MSPLTWFLVIVGGCVIFGILMTVFTTPRGSDPNPGKIQPPPGYVHWTGESRDYEATRGKMQAPKPWPDPKDPDAPPPNPPPIRRVVILPARNLDPGAGGSGSIGTPSHLISEDVVREEIATLRAIVKSQDRMIAEYKKRLSEKDLVG